MANIPEFKLPDWLNNGEASQIQQRMMEGLPPNIDSTPAGWPWNFTMPTALEIAELMQFRLPLTLRIMHPMWAYGEFLDYHGNSVGLSRKQATGAVGEVAFKGIPGTYVPKGYTVAVPGVKDSPSIPFVTTAEVTLDQDGNGAAGVIADVAGASGNVPANTISIMVPPLSGIKMVTNNERTTGGAETEDEEAFRERIMEVISASNDSYVGNDSDYRRWAMEVSGVGDVIVVPEWKGPLTVKLVIVDSNGEPANDEILNRVYNYIVSPDDRLSRLAPIGANLTVLAPEPREISVEIFGLILESGLQPVLDAFKDDIRTYFREANLEGVVRIVQVSAVLAHAEGVVDFSRLTINGGEVNIELGNDEYPVLIDVIVNTGGGG